MIWGLAFKPKTDDIREAPALVLVDHLLDAGSQVVVHDPEAMENVCGIYGDRLTYCDRPLDALDGADALAVMTEWGEFRTPDLAEMRSRMKTPVVLTAAISSTATKCAARASLTIRSADHAYNPDFTGIPISPGDGSFQGKGNAFAYAGWRLRRAGDPFRNRVSPSGSAWRADGQSEQSCPGTT